MNEYREWASSEPVRLSAAKYIWNHLPLHSKRRFGPIRLANSDPGFIEILTRHFRRALRTKIDINYKKPGIYRLIDLALALGWVSEIPPPHTPWGNMDLKDISKRLSKIAITSMVGHDVRSALDQLE